ncbi:hypothetical protein AB6E23_04805 [Vibrio cyclitrophicus]
MQLVKDLKFNLDRITVGCRTSFKSLLNKDSARYILKHHNNHNRVLRGSKWQKLADDMKSGLWDWTLPEAFVLTFDFDGEGLSMQHRLKAFLEQDVIEQIPVRVEIQDRDVWLDKTQEPRTNAETLQLASGVKLNPRIASDISTLTRHLYNLGNGSDWLSEISSGKSPNIISTKKIIGNQVVSLYSRYPIYKISNARIRTGLIAVSLGGCDIKRFFTDGTLESSAIDYINASIPVGQKGDRAFAISVLLHAAATDSTARKYGNIKSSNGRIEFIAGTKTAKYANHSNPQMKVHYQNIWDKIQNESEKFRASEMRRIARVAPAEVVFA